MTNQTADIVQALNHAADIGLGDVAVPAIPNQAANIATPPNINTVQPHLAQGCAVGEAKQTCMVGCIPINKQTTDHMPQPIEHATKSIGVIPNRHKPGTAVPACRGAGINIRPQHIVAGQTAVDSLQLLQSEDDVIGVGAIACGDGTRGQVMAVKDLIARQPQ